MNYRTTIDLKSTDYQLILASQQMGTFFCVYASFQESELNKNNFDVKFDLRCYRGSVVIGIQKVELIEEIGGKFTHIKIHTGVPCDNSEFSIKNLSLEKGSIFICERETQNEETLPNFLVSEERFINNVKNHKTIYQIEKELVKEYIQELKQGAENKIFGASANYCVIGQSIIN